MLRSGARAISAAQHVEARSSRGHYTCQIKRIGHMLPTSINSDVADTSRAIVRRMLRATLLLVISTCALHGQVTFERILNADKEPQNWLTYSGSTSSQRYSLLNQITPANVANVKLHWAFQARSTERFETTPLVVDGTMYLTQMPNDILALDAATGEIKWLYSYSPSREARPCCGR